MEAFLQLLHLRLRRVFQRCAVNQPLRVVHQLKNSEAGVQRRRVIRQQFALGFAAWRRVQLATWPQRGVCARR